MQEPPEIVQHIITRVNEKKVPAVKSYWTPLYTAFGREGEPYVNAILHMGFDVTSFPLNGRFHDSSRFLGKVIGPGGLSKVSETFEDFELPSDPVDSRRIMSLFPRPIAYWGYFILLNFHTFNEAYEKVAPGGILDLSIAIGAPDSFEHIVYPCEEFAALYHKTEKEALEAAEREGKAAFEAAERTAKAKKEEAERTAKAEKEEAERNAAEYKSNADAQKRERDVSGDNHNSNCNFAGHCSSGSVNQPPLEDKAISEDRLIKRRKRLYEVQGARSAKESVQNKLENRELSREGREDKLKKLENCNDVLKGFCYDKRTDAELDDDIKECDE
eukprot:187731_1